ncbi:MAG: hypothetical protein U0002_14725 [Thermoanaerobaculia bacterium]
MVRIEPVEKFGQASKMGEMACFDTVAEAVYYSSGGRTQLPASTQASQITPQMVNSPQAILIGIDYMGTNYTGSSLQWTAPSGCFYNGGSPSYNAASMPFGWDNVISSAQSFSGCRAILYYDLPGPSGLSMVTGCLATSLSFMDNRTSAHQWSDQRYGQFCNF